MFKTCANCGKEFQVSPQRRRYCSQECAHRGHIARAKIIQKRLDSDARRVWAYHEAEVLLGLVAKGVDQIASYIYNNFNRKGK